MKPDELRFVVGLMVGGCAFGIFVLGLLWVRQERRDKREAKEYFRARGLDV
jgi:hypothetical protein